MDSFLLCIFGGHQTEKSAFSVVQEIFVNISLLEITILDFHTYKLNVHR